MTEQTETPEAVARRLLAELRQPWMTDAEAAEHVAALWEAYGARLVVDLAAGVANGYSLAEQEALARQALRAVEGA